MTTIMTGRRPRQACEMCGNPATHVVRERPPLSGEGYVCAVHLPAAERQELKWITRADYTVEAL